MIGAISGIRPEAEATSYRIERARVNRSGSLADWLHSGARNSELFWRWKKGADESPRVRTYLKRPDDQDPHPLLCQWHIAKLSIVRRASQRYRLCAAGAG